jgi:hypothetical protein
VLGPLEGGNPNLCKQTLKICSIITIYQFITEIPSENSINPNMNVIPCVDNFNLEIIDLKIH